MKKPSVNVQFGAMYFSRVLYKTKEGIPYIVHMGLKWVVTQIGENKYRTTGKRLN